MRTLVSLADAISKKDPSGLRGTEDIRASISQSDYDLVMARIAQRAQGVTDPLKIQAIVSSELQKYQGLSTQKHIEWVVDTMKRSSVRADLMVERMGIEVSGRLGPVPISKTLMDTLTVNVKNNIASLTADAQKKVTQALIDGANEGKGMKAMAKDISEATGMERNRASLIARTETMRANVSTSVDRFKQLGVQKVEWLVADDDRLCDECSDLDGEVFDIDDHPDCPLHPQCRCVLIPHVEEEEA